MATFKVAKYTWSEAPQAADAAACLPSSSLLSAPMKPEGGAACLAFHSSPNCVDVEADINIVVVNLPGERKWRSHQGIRHS